MTLLWGLSASETPLTGRGYLQLRYFANFPLNLYCLFGAC